MIIDEMGYFWWDDGKENRKVTPGHLSIDDKGTTTLEMHDRLGGDHEELAVFGSIPLDNLKKIRGVLKKSGKHVLLKKLTTRGATAGQFTYVTFSSKYCLVSDYEINDEQFSGIHIPLSGLESWFQPGEIDVKQLEGNKIELLLEPSEGMEWHLESGMLFLKTGYSGSHPMVGSFRLNYWMHAHFHFVSNQVSSAEDLMKWYSNFEDFISLLVNSHTIFKWPSLTWKSGDYIYSAGCYYAKNHLPADHLDWTKVLLPLQRVKDEFGKILKNWFIKRETLGPGINLYLGTMKNTQLYAEHQFVNMVWGLEALNRRNELAAGNNPSTKINEKAERIFKLIEEAKVLLSDDKRWLKQQMLRLPERSLAERLEELISPVALDIDKKLLRKFCDKCAGLRNDLSHHGGERTPGEYNQFIQSVIPRMHVLRKFYLLIILDLIGLSRHHLTWIMYGHFEAYEFKLLMREVDLLTDEQKKKFH